MRKAPLSWIILTTIFLLAISACVPSALEDNKVTNVRVRRAEPKKSLGQVEEFPLPNCGGTGELSQSLGTQVSVSKSVTIEASASITGGMQKSIPEIVKLQLQASVEAAYQQDYETANSRLDTIQMKAAPGTHVIYQIQWEQREYSSVVTFELNREVLETPYVFILKVPKIAGSRQESCPGIGTVIPPTPITSTEARTDQYAPHIIYSMKEREYNNNGWLIHIYIYFSDADGDAYIVTYKLISASIDSSLIRVSNDEILSSPDEQKHQALIVGTWYCGDKYSNYTATLEARILDRAGNQSEPEVITFECP